MAELVADYVLKRLREWGVRRIYGYPGDGINAFLGAFDRAGGNPEFIQARHEEMAAFMACGHAKFTGEVGVCIATSGPGAIHLLNGLYDAKLDHQPVVAIVGQQAMASLGGNYQQEVDLTTLFKDVAHEYVHMATDPAQVRHLIDRAVRIALDQRTVTCIVVPNDLASEKAVDTPPHKHGTVHSGIGYSRPKVVPEDAELERAARVLNESEKVAILIGRGARLGGADRAAGAARSRPDQPTARLLRALETAARRGDPHLRLGLGGQLVCPRHQDPEGNDGVALGHARDDGTRRSVRDRGQVCASRPARLRARRRRRLPDERDERADHDRQVPRALE